MTYCREKHLTSQCFLTSHTKVKCTRDAIQQLCDVTVLLHQRSKGIQKNITVNVFKLNSFLMKKIDRD